MGTRLLIVDGHPLTRWALARVAGDAPDLEPVGETESAVAALRLVTECRPDVVTVGSTVEDSTGMALVRELRDRFQALGIVVLTERDEDDVLFRAMESGASAFVARTANIPEILAAVRHSAVAACSFSAAGLAAALRRRAEASTRMTLSARELQVLRLLQDGQSVPAIAATLYVSLSTAKTYVARLYDKLGAANRAQALMAAVRLGLVDSMSAAAAG